MSAGVESNLGTTYLPTKTLEFRSLDDACKCGSFCCGDQEIDGWLRGKARKEHQKLRCRVVTAHLAGNDAPVGFYSMCWRLESEKLLHKSDWSLFSQFFRPESGMFATLQLKYVGVQTQLQNQTFGEVIMGHAINAYLQIVEAAGDIPLTLVARNQRAETFYFRLGFRRYGPEVQEMPRMLLPSQSVLDLRN